jgi:hypothetical protein
VIWRGWHHLLQMKLWWLRSTSRICEDLCHHGILVVVLLYIVEARALVVGYLLAGFLCLWCHVVIVVASKLHGLVGWAFAEAMGGGLAG